MTDETIEPSLAENNGLTASGDAPSLAAASKSRDDIVERLEHENDCQLMTGRDFSDLLLDAANEIKRLRSRLQPAAAAVVTTGLEPDPNSSSGFRLSTPHSPAVSAIAQERDVGDWQPIETAPKDGSVFLIVDMKSSRPMAYAACWWPERDDLYPWAIFEGVNTDGGLNSYSRKYPPTHWMPMPEPPSNPAGGSKAEPR